MPHLRIAVVNYEHHRLIVDTGPKALTLGQLLDRHIAEAARKDEGLVQSFTVEFDEADSHMLRDEARKIKTSDRI